MNSILIMLTVLLGAERPPNVVLVFTDDQGWGDLGCQGSTEIPTPNIDRLAVEGMRFTDFYVSQPVCSASRSSLLTGCYANRIGISGALVPSSKIGIADDETTIAEMLRPRGYTSGCFGKWHLGHHPEFLPTRHGFERYSGIPYSNDMWPGHPESPKAWPPLPWYTIAAGDESPQVTIVEDLDDQDLVTRRSTEEAVSFIHEHAAEPFFLYLPHSMPHVPLGVGPRFRQSNAYGAYGDVIREIDWSVGQLRAALEEEGVMDETIFIFASDNGPWLSYGDHAGTTGGLREGKGTTFEGGVRVPFIVRYPGVVPAGTTSNEPCMTIDVLPTLATLTGSRDSMGSLEIDGKDISSILKGVPGARSPHEALYFWYRRGDLEAMRSGQWKLHFPHGYRTMNGRQPGNNGIPGKYDYSVSTGLELYDLSVDPNETTNVAALHPDVMDRLHSMSSAQRLKLGDSLNKIVGTDVREPGRLIETNSK
jgi:arylsulfatase A-like enzyme